MHEALPRADFAGYAAERLLLPQGIGAKDIIAKTRDKIPLNKEEIEGFINEFTAGIITDYQAAAWLMAVRLNRLTLDETVNLTMAMAYSGERLDLSSFGKVADKHSSGGVGDKPTLVVAPLVAACDIPVGKMSGRGLAHTGGTLDKLEAIPGFRVNLSVEEFLNQLQKIGIVVTGQTADLAPADGKLYALRDATETVKSLPLIASSIMSKKIASGANILVLDVKTGRAAFMETLDEARELARIMVDIGRSAGITCAAEISDMNQPLGEAVGNSLEVLEAIETLKGRGPADFSEHCLDTAARIVLLAGKASSLEQAKAMVAQKLEQGYALQKFAQMVEAQGGNPRVAYDPLTVLPQARFKQSVLAGESGYVAAVDPLEVGRTAMRLGGGRAKKNDPIDYSVGVIVRPNVGDRIETGQPIFEIHANHEDRLRTAAESLQKAVSVSPKPVDSLPLIYEVVE